MIFIRLFQEYRQQETNFEFLNQGTRENAISTNWPVLHVVGVPTSELHHPKWCISLPGKAVSSLENMNFTWLQVLNLSEVNCAMLQSIWALGSDFDYKANDGVSLYCWLRPHKGPLTWTWRKGPIRGPVQPSSWRPKLTVVSISPSIAMFPNAPRFLFLGSERDE